VTTLAALAKLLRNQKQAITSKFPRHKLANDGTKVGPGQAIVTPGIIKSELIAQYQRDMYDGLVEDMSNFKRNLLVERDPNDSNRVNVLYPPDLINQLRIFTVLKLLYRPIRNNKGEEIKEVSLREPRAGDINRYGNPIRVNQDGDVIIDERKMTYIIAALTDILPPFIEQMDTRDWNSVAYRLRRFFLPDPGAW
jgi:hypothetical protein